MTSGRNDLCPCGSGKTHKRCCGAGGGAFHFPTEAAQSALTRRLCEFLTRHTDEGEIEAACEALVGGRQGDLDPDTDDVVGHNTTTYLIYDALLHDEGTVVERFLARHGERLTPAERRYLEAVCDTYIGFYEVSEAVPGKGLRLNDLLGGGCIWVREVVASHHAVRWSILGARVLVDPSRGEGTFLADMYPRPWLHMAAVLQALREELGIEAQHEFDAQELLDELKELAPVYFQACWDLMCFPLGPAITNLDGHSFLQSRTTYDVTDPEQSRASLAGIAELEGDEEGVWTLSREIQGQDRLIARVEFEGARLAIETDSDERTREARALEERLGELLRFRSTSASDLCAQVERERDAGFEGDEDSAPPDPEAKRMRLAFLDKKYRAWVDEPVPLLGDRTPRQAAACAQREEVADLIKGIEHIEATHALAGGVPYDCSWMWAELGLDAPGR